MNAREEILRRLRGALRDEPAPVSVPREYRRDIDGDLEETFSDRLLDYRARVRRTDHPAEAVAEALATADTVLTPRDAPTEWLSRFGGNVVIDAALSVPQLDSMDAVVTGCAVAIAQTGTIILDTGATQGRRAISLIPDHHVVVVKTEQIVGTVAQALPWLNPTGPQTWISGPSATSDIELTRVEGVHGPRELDVVIVRS